MTPIHLFAKNLIGNDIIDSNSSILKDFSMDENGSNSGMKVNEIRKSNYTQRMRRRLKYPLSHFIIIFYVSVFRKIKNSSYKYQKQNRPVNKRNSENDAQITNISSKRLMKKRLKPNLTKQSINEDGISEKVTQN